MGRLVVLNLGQGNLDDGFPYVTVQVGEPNNTYCMKITGSLPSASDIRELYRCWQSVYSAFYQRLELRLGGSAIEKDDEFEIEEAFITNVSEIDISDLCHRLSSKINLWLDSQEFRKIDQQLRTQLKPSEEITFIIETNNTQIQRLPWHLWHFFEDYPNAEVVLSTDEYYQTAKLPAFRTTKVKILAIFGSSKGIDIKSDRHFLEKLANRAEIEFLVEPSLDKVNNQLWQREWDILFFAGHSFTEGKGCLQINSIDTISLDQLKYGLMQAIARGLKLAIFNSCDSLGLAQQLQDLQIPQVIVMREPVPDIIAQEFLKNFLANFSSGKSLYAAVRAARLKLQGMEKEYPCATWLPVICQNPSEMPMIWCTKSKSKYLTKKTTQKNNLKFPIRAILIASILLAASFIGIHHLEKQKVFLENPDSSLLIITTNKEDYPASKIQLQYKDLQKQKILLIGIVSQNNTKVQLLNCDNIIDRQQCLFNNTNPKGYLP